MKTQDRIYCATRLVLLNRTPFPEIAKAPFKTFPGAKEVLYTDVISPPATAAVKARAKHIIIAVRLSLTSSEQLLNDANCDPATISINTNAKTNDSEQIVTLLIN